MSSDKNKPASEPEAVTYVRHPSMLPPMGPAEEAIVQARTAVFKPGVSLPPDITLNDVPSGELLRAVAQLRGIKIEEDTDASDPATNELSAEHSDVLDALAVLEMSIKGVQAPEPPDGKTKRRRKKGEKPVAVEVPINWTKKPENPGVAVARVADIARAVVARKINRTIALEYATPLIASFGPAPTKMMEQVRKELEQAIGKQGAGKTEEEVAEVEVASEE